MNKKQRLLVLFSFLAMALSGCDQPNVYQNNFQGEGIVNGTDVTEDEVLFNRVLSLKTTYKITNEQGEERSVTSQCSASAIAPRIILTAAHCIFANTTAQNIELIKNSQVFKFRVIDTISHPLFHENNKYDIAVLILESRLPEEIEILDLAKPDDPTPEMILAAGYGRSDGRKQSPQPGTGVLRKKNLKVNLQIEDPLVFTVEQEDGGACQGDSGSPALASIGDREVIYGVLARTIYFDPDQDPNVDRCRYRSEYTRVVSFLDFIRSSSRTLLMRYPY